MNAPEWLVIRVSADPKLSRGAEVYRQVSSMGGRCRTWRRHPLRAYTEVTFPIADLNAATFAGELLRRFGGTVYEPARLGRILAGHDTASEARPLPAHHRDLLDALIEGRG